MTSGGSRGHSSISWSRRRRRWYCSPHLYLHSSSTQAHSLCRWVSRSLSSPCQRQPSAFFEQYTRRSSTLRWKYLSSMVSNGCWQVGQRWPAALIPPTQEAHPFWPQQLKRLGSRKGSRHRGQRRESGGGSTKSQSYPPVTSGDQVSLLVDIAISGYGLKQNRITHLQQLKHTSHMKYKEEKYP